eukprot:2510958-Rhodomonas_salina.1
MCKQDTAGLPPFMAALLPCMDALRLFMDALLLFMDAIPNLVDDLPLSKDAMPECMDATLLLTDAALAICADALFACMEEKRPLLLTGFPLMLFVIFFNALPPSMAAFPSFMQSFLLIFGLLAKTPESIVMALGDALRFCAGPRP